MSLSKPFSDFLKLKSDFTKFCYFLILTNVFLGMGMPKAMCRLIPQEGGRNTDVDMSNSRILIKSPLADFLKSAYFYICKCIFGDGYAKGFVQAYSP